MVGASHSLESLLHLTRIQWIALVLSLADLGYAVCGLHVREDVVVLKKKLYPLRCLLIALRSETIQQHTLSPATLLWPFHPEISKHFTEMNEFSLTTAGKVGNEHPRFTGHVYGGGKWRHRETRLAQAQSMSQWKSQGPESSTHRMQISLIYLSGSFVSPVREAGAWES